MNFFLSNIFAQIIIGLSVFAIAFSSPTDDSAFLGFVKGPVAFEQFCADKEITSAQSKEMLAQIYGTHLGLLHHMRKQWQSANSNAKIPNKNERCQFQKCLDALYVYLLREHIGHNGAVKPIFLYSTYDRSDRGFATVFDDIKCMARVSKIHFDWPFGEDNEERMAMMLDTWESFDEPPLILNESALMDYFKATNAKRSQQKVLQTDQSKHRDGPQAIARAKFEKTMEKMYRKAVENKEKMEQNETDEKIFLLGDGQLLDMEMGQPSSSSLLASSTSSSLASKSADKKPKSADKYHAKKKDAAILHLLVYKVESVIEDEAFLLFVKGQPNFIYVLEYAFDMVTRHNRRQTVDEIEKRFWTQKYEKHLGILHLMRRDWHCAENNAKFKPESSSDKNAQEIERNDPAMVQYDKSTECKKFRSYLDMVYEYLFRVHNGVDSAVKPIFEMSGTIHTLIDAISVLGKISNLNFGFELENFVNAQKLKLLNWNELLKYRKTAAKPKFQTEEVFIHVASKKPDHQKLTDEAYEGLLRHNFDKYLEAMWVKWHQKTQKMMDE